MSKIQDFKMYINGEWVDSSSGKKIETLNPENNEVWATVPEANEKDVIKLFNQLKKLLKIIGLHFIQEKEQSI
jgi:aldehyde dehydrogenase (NAD+)/betaine-aldehyde dehydrogenase